MPNDTGQRAADDFELEAQEPGKIPAGVIEELRLLRTAMNEGATDFREAIKIQADKHKIKPAALRRYVVALGNDKIEELRVEVENIEGLIG